jgi:leucyl-tRNA synthetase
MPGWAGSSFYWMRYMDPKNENEFASKEALAYWESVDLYIGGNEHATGHLLYSRFWNKFLKDKGVAPTEEPFKKLINQGMILGTSAFVYRLEIEANKVSVISADINNEIVSIDIKEILKSKKPIFISKNSLSDSSDGRKITSQHFRIDEKNFSSDSIIFKYFLENNLLKEDVLLECVKGNYSLAYQVHSLHADVSMVNASDELDIEAFKKWREDYKDAEFICEDNGKYIVGREVEKMSKSKYNVVTPDDICEEYGADTLRLYEMFLGPLEQAKPWNTAGISGVFGFLKKLCRLYFDEHHLIVTNEVPTKDNLKTLHKTIKKVADDIENFSFNTSVSQFMICVNELTAQGCHSRAILEPLAIVISPYAPHIAEELWSLLGNKGSIARVPFPVFEPKHLIESSKEYPVSFNGKMRFTIELPLDLTKDQIEEIIMKDERTIKQLEGRTPNKVIIVPGKIINLVG